MVTQVISDINRQIVDALRRGDAAAFAALYTDDARLLPPNSPTLTDRQAIEAFWQGVIDLGISDVTLDTVQIEELGDTAIEVGTYTLDIQPPGGDAAKDVGKYVIIWKRQADGAWKLAVDIFNSDLPAAE